MFISAVGKSLKSPVRFVEIRNLKSIMMIMVNRLRFDGCVAGIIWNWN